MYLQKYEVDNIILYCKNEKGGKIMLKKIKKGGSCFNSYNCNDNASYECYGYRVREFGRSNGRISNC